MSTDVDPIVDGWYDHLDKGQKFKVVAVEDYAGNIEIQYFDGDLDEIDLEAWYLLDIEPIEAPEDWTGPMDDIEEDDLGYTDTGTQSDDWAAEPLALALALKSDKIESSEPDNWDEEFDED